MNFSEQIKNIRISNNLTQEQLAAILSISRQTISSWETGRNLPDLEMVVAIAKHFNISLDELILGGDDMTKKLIRDGSENRKAKMNMISIIIGSALLCIGLLCILIKAFTPEYVDADGFLHEYFFLLPIGFLFLFSGILTFVITGIKNLIRFSINRISR